MSRRWQILIDTGGTFTDCIAIHSSVGVKRLKVLSNSTIRLQLGSSYGNKYRIESDLHFNPESLIGYHSRTLDGSLSAQIINASDAENCLEFDADEDWSAKEIEVYSTEEVPVFAIRLITNTSRGEKIPAVDLRLGSTKGTNALLEQKVARTALITNSGFEDLLEIGTQQRPDIFSLEIVRREQFYQKVFGLDTRQEANGKERIPIDLQELAKITTELTKNNIESVAVGLLNSYQNGSHEERVANHLKRAGFKYVSGSAALSPEIKMLPRIQTAVVNACLAPIIEDYVDGIRQALSAKSTFDIMTSSGGLHTAEKFVPKDSLLSGPAGGIVGAAALAKKSGESKVITLDIGGTSADVALYQDSFSYRYENTVGDATILSPALDIHTVAAGGGSICHFDGYVLRVGPESAGASPGPACYGKGGPLTLTDVALLAGRLNPNSSHLPLDLKAAQRQLEYVADEVKEKSGSRPDTNDLIESFLQIANEKMANAIKEVSLKKGFDTSEYALLAFGGAGGQFACDIAEKLLISSILAPSDGGLLSALGMGLAKRERFGSHQFLKSLGDVINQIPGVIDGLRKQLHQQFSNDGFSEEIVKFLVPSYTLRYLGQETPIEIHCDSVDDLASLFEDEYKRLMGHTLDREIELVSIRQQAFIDTQLDLFSVSRVEDHDPKPISQQPIPTFDWDELDPGALITGPALVLNPTSTLYIKNGWHGRLDGLRSFRLERSKAVHTTLKETNQAEARLELFTNRFLAVAEQMGSILERNSFSVNIKERLDFSCAILNSKGQLVANAPHIPVHLGSLGICVRSVVERLNLNEGDIAITNHPAYGGSHLPDVTLIAPVYFENILVAYVVNRAHHAEIGGINPGSMPTSAKCLEEEGVVITPQLLVESGSPRWAEIEKLLTSAKYPSRNVAENIADLRGAVASIHSGIAALQRMCSDFGSEEVLAQMENILEYASVKLRNILFDKIQKPISSKENLDNGAALEVELSKQDNMILIDFDGTAPTDVGNMNATPAIVSSTVLYVLRLLVNEEIPLNEGLLRDVKIRIPTSLLSPVFSDDPAECPAVVGGNTEVSQRLTDLLLKVLGLSACSQGTMNNVVFGNDKYGYYETIGGGSGAGNGFNGSNAVHQHMTNTRITDPEVLEFRYPVEVTQYRIRKGSGGRGVFKGGDGVIRGLRFKENTVLNLLSQHRKEAPYGLNGGEAGETGKQYLFRDGQKIELKGVAHIEVREGDEFVIETPGGGGYGQLEQAP